MLKVVAMVDVIQNKLSRLKKKSKPKISTKKTDISVKTVFLPAPALSRTIMVLGGENVLGRSFRMGHVQCEALLSGKCIECRNVRYAFA